jgi:hypothetical protein
MAEDILRALLSRALKTDGASSPVDIEKVYVRCICKNARYLYEGEVYEALAVHETPGAFGPVVQIIVKAENGAALSYHAWRFRLAEVGARKGLPKIRKSAGYCKPDPGVRKRKRSEANGLGSQPLEAGSTPATGVPVALNG